MKVVLHSSNIHLTVVNLMSATISSAIRLRKLTTGTRKEEGSI